MEPRNITLDLDETEFTDTLHDLKKHPRSAHSAIPHITNHLNETYFENTSIDAKSHRIRRKEYRDIASVLNETEIYDELLGSRKLHGHRRPVLPSITGRFNETYFDNTLHHAKNHTGALCARNQHNSTYNNPEPPPLDIYRYKTSQQLRA